MSDAASRLRPRAAPKPNTSAAPRTRRQRERISYNEDDTDSDDVEEYVSQDDDTEPDPVARPKKPRGRPSRSTRTSTRLSRKRKVTATMRDGTSVVAKKLKSTNIHAEHEKGGRDQRAMQLSGRVMPWTTLPYYILASIFAYASYPVALNMGNPSPSVAWLLKMALVCKAFTEPALSALYYEPPIYYPRPLQSLVAMLENQTEGFTLNYRSKIRQLSISSINGLLKDPHIVMNMIALTPRLQGIALGIHSDDPKLCRLHTITNTTFTHDDMSIFLTLSNTQTKLESWTWNRTLAFHYHPLSVIRDVHLTPAFLTLRSLTFVDFHLPTKVDYDGIQIYSEEALADALSVLPSLRKIEFRLADAVNERLMPLLPGKLQTLILKSCYNLFSPALEDFLATKGQHIRELVLSHNQSLNLSFLTGLSRACPKLENLNMDLLYYNSHTTFKDSTPRYNSLLGDGEQPSWPASLRRIELLQLRRWKAAAAECFFSSLIESAESLPNLRHMEIKASINESGWRERIAFRNTWVQRLEATFLRRCTPPRPYLQSFSAYRDWKAKQSTLYKANGLTVPTQSARGNDPSALGISVTQTIDLTTLSDNSDSDVPLKNVCRTTRGRPRKQIAYDESESESESSHSQQDTRRRSSRRLGTEKLSNEAPRIDKNKAQEFIRVEVEKQARVQGLCNVVDIVIDNLRPAEEQLHESDFLDEERSGDEDWNGDDE